MAAYYNEINPFAAAWLRELIKAGHIADGEVDERSIADVQPGDVRGFTQCHFFAGIGGWSYALRLTGWPDDRAVWTGSCPCQPFSLIGAQVGGDDPRHLWPSWFFLIAQRRPVVVFGEQVESAISHGWYDLICDDMEGVGYAVGACCLPAASVGAPHVRSRLFFVADAAGEGRRRGATLAQGRCEATRRSGADLRDEPWPDGRGSGSTVAVGDLLSPPYGVPGRMGRLRGYGNAIVPQVAAAFIEAYMSIGEPVTVDAVDPHAGVTRD